MECPFCAEQIKDEALVCKHCSRDLKIPKPLIEENRELLDKLEKMQHEVARLRAELARRASPARYWSSHLAIYVVPPILLLLAAHALLVIRLDLNPLVLRIVSMIVPLPFGFALAWVGRLGWRTAAAVGVVVGVVSVFGMTTIVGYVDNLPILPENAREWRETIEYAASIALAMLTGNLLAAIARNMLPRSVSKSVQPSPLAMRLALIVSPHVGKQTQRRRAERIETMLAKAGSVGAALGAASGTVYTGIRALASSL